MYKAFAKLKFYVLSYMYSFHMQCLLEIKIKKVYEYAYFHQEITGLLQDIYRRMFFFDMVNYKVS